MDDHATKRRSRVGRRPYSRRAPPRPGQFFLSAATIVPCATATSFSSSPLTAKIEHVQTAWRRVVTTAVARAMIVSPSAGFA